MKRKPEKSRLLPSFNPIEKLRLDVLLKRVIPASYNSFPKRYRRSIQALLCVRNKMPGDKRDGKLTHTPETAALLLSYYATPAGSGPANVVMDVIREGLSNARSDAARASAVKASKSTSRCRDRGTGKFRRRKKS